MLIITCGHAVVGGKLIVPLHGPQLAAPSLGMQVEIWDQSGRNIEDSGLKGDLVITKPFFSMPVTFWGEEGHEKYRKAYLDVFPGIWCHGDFISKDFKTQCYIIHGRSDGVLNPGGMAPIQEQIFRVQCKLTIMGDLRCPVWHGRSL